MWIWTNSIYGSNANWIKLISKNALINIYFILIPYFGPPLINLNSISIYSTPSISISYSFCSFLSTNYCFYKNKFFKLPAPFWSCAFAAKNASGEFCMKIGDPFGSIKDGWLFWFGLAVEFVSPFVDCWCKFAINCCCICARICCNWPAADAATGSAADCCWIKFGLI